VKRGKRVQTYLGVHLRALSWARGTSALERGMQEQRAEASACARRHAPFRRLPSLPGARGGAHTLRHCFFCVPAGARRRFVQSRMHEGGGDGGALTARLRYLIEERVVTCPSAVCNVMHLGDTPGVCNSFPLAQCSVRRCAAVLDWLAQ
jgi:hypothetical protein